MNIEVIAAEVVKQYRSSTISNYLADVDNDILYKICAKWTVDWAYHLFGRINSGNEAVLQLFGNNDQGKCIDLTFNDITRIICSDEVIKQMVELLKVNQNK